MPGQPATDQARKPRDPRVAVIIVNYNGGDDVDRTLTALSRQTVPPTRTIVVDNASTDGSPDRIAERFPDVELVRLDTNAGFAAANNLAVRRTEDCELIALLNPDAFPEPTWLETLLAAARAERGFDSFGSRLMLADADGMLDGSGDIYHVSGFAWRRDHMRAAAEAPRRREEIFSVCAAAALYRRHAFIEDGGFDENFFCYLEDVDLGFRMRLRGRRALYVPESVVHHVGSATSGRTSDFQIYHSQRNLVWTYVKDMPPGLLWFYLPQHVVLNLAVIAWFSLRGRAPVVVRAKLDALKGLRPILARRRALQRDRTIGSRQLRPEMARGASAYTVGWGRARGA